MKKKIALKRETNKAIVNPSGLGNVCNIVLLQLHAVGSLNTDDITFCACG